MSSAAFVILAAGKGERLGGVPKQFRCLGGAPLWRWSLETAKTLREEGLVQEIFLVLPPRYDCEPLQDNALSSVRLLTGGAARSLSVLAALRAARSDLALLHDCARPFLGAELCRRLLAAFDGANAVIPLLPEANALKKMAHGRICAIDRENVWITQTPQLFPRLELLALLESAQAYSFKDEAELWLAQGRKLDYTLGERLNYKITEEGDWQMAQMLAESWSERRCGIGYDVHPFRPGRKLVLGGVTIPSPLGLHGHSDADALCHSIADSLLSAAGLPDIGTLYPADSEIYRDVKSTLLLKDAFDRVSDAGWSIEWVSAVVTAQTPKLAPWKDQMISVLESILGKDRVGITFKSGEGVPPAGSSEALFVWTSSTLKRSLKSNFSSRA